MELGGTDKQQLVYLNTHWGNQYSFSAPAGAGGQWAAVAKFGRLDQIEDDSATDLLEKVRLHWSSHQRQGTLSG
jgi:hypothetical protein